MRRDDADWWHLCREADRRAASRPVDAKTLRARRLLADDISYDRAYGEIMRDRSAPEAMVDALVFSLGRGANDAARHAAAAVGAGCRPTRRHLPLRSSIPATDCTRMVRRRCGSAHFRMEKIS
jgi:hypothetical protein